MRTAAKDALDHKRDGQIELAGLAVCAVREWTHRADWAMAHNGECVLSDYEAAKGTRMKTDDSCGATDSEIILCLQEELKDSNDERHRLRASFTVVGDKLIQAEKERDQARAELCREQEKLKLADEKQIRENIEHLITVCAKKTELLRAVRHSMDSEKPFPSLEKITEAINL